VNGVEPLLRGPQQREPQFRRDYKLGKRFVDGGKNVEVRLVRDWQGDQAPVKKITELKGKHLAKQRGIEKKKSRKLFGKGAMRGGGVRMSSRKGIRKGNRRKDKKKKKTYEYRKRKTGLY